MHIYRYYIHTCVQQYRVRAIIEQMDKIKVWVGEPVVSFIRAFYEATHVKVACTKPSHLFYLYTCMYINKLFLYKYSVYLTFMCI